MFSSHSIDSIENIFIYTITSHHITLYDILVHDLSIHKFYQFINVTPALYSGYPIQRLAKTDDTRGESWRKSISNAESGLNSIRNISLHSRYLKSGRWLRCCDTPCYEMIWCGWVFGQVRISLLSTLCIVDG